MFFVVGMLSVLMIPWYLYCTSWMFQELCALSGLTFWEFIEKGQNRVPMATHSRRSRSRRTRAVLGVLLETSEDPEETQRLFRRYCYSTLPAAAAMFPISMVAVGGQTWLPLVVDGAIFLLGLVLKFQAGSYRTRHPRNLQTEAKLEQRRAKDQKAYPMGKLAGGYVVFGLFFLGMAAIIFLGASGAFQRQSKPTTGVEPPTLHSVDTMLYAMGFETEDVSTSYWMYEESKLEQQVAGTTLDERFEFYVYSNDDSSLGAYNAICYDLTRDLEPDQRDAYEESLPFGGEGFTYTRDGITYYVLCWENTVVYAYAPEGGERISNMLEGLEYFEH